MNNRSITNSGAATAMPRSAARLAIAAVLTYQAVLIALIFIRADLDPSWHTISEWALGRYGWLMVLAFLTSALAYGSLFVAIRSEVRGAWGRIGRGLLLICTVGTFGVGVFVTDPMPLTPPLSTRGTLHAISGSSAMLLLPFAALLINLSLAFRNERWATARGPLLWTAGLPLLGLASSLIHLAVFVMPLGKDAYGPGVHIGWPPRFVLLSYMVWLIALARQAIRLNTRPSA